MLDSYHQAGKVDSGSICSTRLFAATDIVGQNYMLHWYSSNYILCYTEIQYDTNDVQKPFLLL